MCTYRCDVKLITPRRSTVERLFVNSVPRCTFFSQETHINYEVKTNCSYWKCAIKKTYDTLLVNSHNSSKVRQKSFQ